MTNNTINNGQINLRCGIVAWGRYGNSASSRLDDQHFEVVLHRDDIDDTPGGGAEQINPLGRRWCR